MKCRWVVENFTDSEDYRDLVRAIRDSGRECFVIGKHNHFDFDPSGFVKPECIVVQGSIQMTKHIKEKLPQGCYPVSYTSWEKFLCSAYYEPLKDFLFNDNHAFTTLKHLKENKFHFYERFGKEALIFVRPDSGEKQFQAQLIDLQDFDRFWENGIQCSSAETDLLVVSTPKKIIGEWRYVCTRKKVVVAVSTYKYQEQRTYIPSAPAGATELCKQILEVGYYPNSVFCVDICQDGDGNYWLMELTSFSSAGLYATNKDAVVKAVSEMAEEEWAALHP